MSLAADEAKRRETLRRARDAWECRNRRRWTIASLAMIVLGLVGPTIGAWNPWNLVAVDRTLDHPVLGGVLVVVALIILWSEHVWRPWVRRGGFVVCGLLVAGLVLGSGFLIATQREPVESRVAQSTFSDVEVRVTEAAYDFGDQIWEVWLYASRGLASREHHVAVLKVLDYGTVSELVPIPAVVTASFSADDELVVQVNRRVAYRLHFDPGDLGVESEDCTPVSGPNWSGEIGCTSDLTEWEI